MLEFCEFKVSHENLYGTSSSYTLPVYEQEQYNITITRWEPLEGSVCNQMNYGSEYLVKFYCGVDRDFECSEAFNWFNMTD